jgi:hypothetical protein
MSEDGITVERMVRGWPLRAEAQLLDSGVHVLLTGGCRTHVGAVSLAEVQAGRTPAVQTLQREGHRDAAVSEAWAGELCAALQVPVCVCAGIHYEHATRPLRAEVLEASRLMLHDVLCALRPGAPSGQEAPRAGE